jgi:hypothetical protein
MEHWDAPLPLNLPALQLEQVDAPELEYVPALQLAQSDLLS